MTYNRFVNNIYFPLTQKFKKEKIHENLIFLEKSQYYSETELRQLQLQKLQNLLKTANQSVPYYQNLFRENRVIPEEIMDLDNIHRIPYLNKEIITIQKNNLYSTNYSGKVYAGTTSGSTGTALNFVVNSEYNSWDWASRWRGRRWYNVDIGDREFAIWGRPVYSKLSRFTDPIKAIFRNTILVDGFNVSNKRLEKYCYLIIHFKPDYIYGYSVSVFQLANFMRKHFPGRKIPRLKAVFVTAEMLYPHQRQIIEEVFNAPVSNEYGCSEIGGFAYECKSGNWHISTENVIVESVSIDGGSPELVLTSLTNYYMPFIRYRIGDLGEISALKCNCGVKLPILKFNAGKTTDVIILKNGKKITSEIFLYLTRAMVENHFQPFKKFRIVQNDLETFTIAYEEDRYISESSKEKFKNLLLKSLKAENITVHFEKVSEIPKEKNGKFRYFISEINQSI